jgi:hypothetical protein
VSETANSSQTNSKSQLLFRAPLGHHPQVGSLQVSHYRGWYPINGDGIQFFDPLTGRLLFSSFKLQKTGSHTTKDIGAAPTAVSAAETA